MIKIENQIVVQISIDKFTDFINSYDLIDLFYLEQAGMVLPYLRISFRTMQEELLSYLNDGAILNVSMGRDELTLTSMQFQIIKAPYETTYIGHNVTIEALAYLPLFMKYSTSTNFIQKSSLDVFNTILPKHFKNIDTSTITKTLDKQDWSQEGISDYQFLKDVWLHSYISEDTFIASAFNYNKFYLKDIRETIKSQEPWSFTQTSISPKSSTSVVNFSSYQTSNDFGAANQLIGRGVINNTFNFDSGTYLTTTSKLKNFTIIGSDKINLNEQNCLKPKFTFVTGDFHPNYVKSYDQNTRNLVMFSNFKVFLSFGAQYKKLELLQPATIQPAHPDKALQGVFLIERIGYQIKDNKLMTNVTLCKEGPSGIKGESLSQ